MLIKTENSFAIINIAKRIIHKKIEDRTPLKIPDGTIRRGWVITYPSSSSFFHMDADLETISIWFSGTTSPLMIQVSSFCPSNSTGSPFLIFFFINLHTGFRPRFPFNLFLGFYFIICRRRFFNYGSDLGGTSETGWIFCFLSGNKIVFVGYASDSLKVGIRSKLFAYYLSTRVRRGAFPTPDSLKERRGPYESVFFSLYA